MERIGVLLRQSIDQSGLKAAEVARRANVSASTVSRILNGQVSPSLDTVEELFAACQQQLTVTAQAPSDPSAALAARWLLDGEYEGDDVEALEAWAERLVRWSDDDPVAMVELAAEHSGVMRRPDSIYLRGHVTMGRLASAGSSSEQRWAISGAAGVALPAFRADVPAVTILWCEDPAKMRRLLNDPRIAEATAPHRATVVLASAAPELFSGSFEHDRISYASPVQIAIDSISIGGLTGDAAMKEISSW
ncbi:MAG: helix-turn-helix transcriptional regulator [Aeromicrobium sp.]|uniref:helix-turn-helix domain-containing protein n=1 Tax=Aeromicrobium sp. TaxID=1871063 RepID=UPI0039E21888